MRRRARPRTSRDGAGRRHQRGHDPGRTRGATPTSPPARRASWPGLARRRAGLPLRARRRGRGHRPARPTAPGCSAGDVVMRVSGPVAGLLTAERTALNFACHLSGVATATAALGRGARGHPRAGAGHPQDPARLPRACRSTPCAAAAGSTTGSACPTWRWSRTTTCSPPAGWCRPSRRCARGYPDLPGRGRGHRPRPAARAARRRLRADPARQHERRADGRGGAAHRRPGHAWRPPAGSPSSGPARSPRPASTSSRSAR